MTSLAAENASSGRSDSGTDGLEAARKRQQELLPHYQRLLNEATQKNAANSLSTGEVLRNRLLMVGLPLGCSAATFWATESVLWGVGVLVGSFVGVITLMLMIFPDTSTRPGTRGFEAEQEIVLINQFMTQVLERPLDRDDLASVEHTNRAIEHYITELQERIPNLGSLEPGRGVISVERHSQE